MAPRFVDRVVIHARAGNGGNGCASVHREKFKPLGGPDGGNGGKGGSIVLVVDPQVHTLLDFHFRPHVDAPSGKPGAGSNRDGAAGADLEVRVPDGTVVQRVQMTDARGTPWLATYTLQLQKDKSWRISGCDVQAHKGRVA